MAFGKMLRMLMMLMTLILMIMIMLVSLLRLLMMIQLIKGSVLREKEEDGLWANDGEVWSLHCAPGYQVF